MFTIRGVNRINNVQDNDYDTLILMYDITVIELCNTLVPCCIK